MKIALMVMGLGISWIALALLKQREKTERQPRTRPVVAHGYARGG